MLKKSNEKSLELKDITVLQLGLVNLEPGGGTQVKWVMGMCEP